MLEVVSNHSSTLTTILDSADLVPSLRAVHCNALKMNCYGLVRLAEAFETEPSKSNLVGLDPKRKSKKSQGTSFLWEEERQHVLQLLTQLLQLDLHRLWTSSIVEEEFVSLMTGCCYHILENPGIGHQKHRPTREAAIHLLGVALRRYDHMLSATLKVTQMLQHFEHVAPVFVEAVSLWIKEYGMRSIVGELLREIGQKCPQELARDTSATKGYASFLTELAEQVPAVVLANMSVLLHHLDGESYGIRNAILAAMAEMLLQVLNGEQLEDAARSTRDQFLDTLQAHTCDVHGLVRSRMLQLFTRIVQQKLSCTDLTELLQKEKEETPGNEGQVQNHSCCYHRQWGTVSNSAFFFTLQLWPIPPEEEWEAMQPELQATREELSWLPAARRGGGRTFEVGDPAQVSDRIIQLLRKSSYKDAVLLVQGAIHCFQETEPFVNCTRTEEEDEEDFLLRLLRTLYTGPQPRGDAQEPIVGAENTEGEEHGAEGQPSSELAKQEMLVQYLQDAYNFSAKITDAMSLISRMMYESSISVVQEAIEFFVIVSQFGIPQAVLGVRRMLPLIWSKEPGIREAVLNAYRRLYLKPSGGSERARAHSLLQSLSLLMVDASLATIQCLGEIISEFVQKDEIKPAVVQLLWEQFTEKSECSALERHAAIMLLGMMARGKPEIVGSNLDILVTVGLDDRVHENYRLAQEVCNAISKITSGQKPALGKSGTPIRLPQSHLLFERLSKAVIMGFVGSSPHWIPFTETAITLIYQLAEEPEEVCTRILQHCSQQTLEKLGEVEGTEAEPGSSPTGGAGDSSHVDALLLTHLVSLAGDVALQQLVHLELAVSAELRRRRILGEEQEMKERTGSNVKDVRIKSTGNETTMEMELGLVGASAEDTEAELIRSICETELLEGKQLLSTFVPLVLKICNNPGHYSDPALSAAAALALGKFCMVSAEFCDAHLRLLFTMMEKSALPSVRANLMIVAGDLAIRFPNQVEPWTPHLYARLRDPCHQVRRTAALVMTHLILKDMVKVKGQVSEMAALLIDPEEEIVALARNFFAELSGKDNAVYNLLPDIISRLSDPDSGIEEQPFRTIMRQLFSYVTKDRQTESLVEKLCQRFRTARTERQHRDLGFCLTLLPLTDRGLRKMQDNFECFGDKLQDAAVYSCFQTALGRLRRLSTKPEMKTLVEEFEQKLQKCHNRGLDSIAESPTESRCPGSNSRPAPQTAKRTATSSRRQRKPDSSFITPQPRVSRAHRKISKQVYVVFSSDEGNSPEEAELSEDETPSKTTPISRASSRRVQ
uniref:Uncharacterized protein n=1 Tax=Sphaerodactylus townsendi TaxID=933632 RepID=A0ACB8ES41_9SAUR